MSNENSNFDDLGTEARLAVFLSKAGALDHSLGFLTRRIRNDFGSCKDGLGIVIEELRGQVPQCFAEEKVDEHRTRKQLDAMPNNHDELMAGIGRYFAERKAVKTAMAKGH